MKALPKLPFPGAVDGDGHVLEPPDLWEHYLETGLRKRAPGIRVDDEGLEYLEIDGVEHFSVLFASVGRVEGRGWLEDRRPPPR